LSRKVVQARASHQNDRRLPRTANARRSGSWRASFGSVGARYESFSGELMPLYGAML